jgi:signal recognition particle receptor subunit beta
MDGYIVMTDLSRGEQALEEAASMLEHFRGISDVPFIIGANRAKSHPELFERLNEIMRAEPDATIVPCEAADKESAKEVLLVLLIKVLSALADETEVSVG